MAVGVLPETLPAALIPSYSISIVIPAYDEARAIGQVLSRLTPWMAEGVEVIVVDDGSHDQTAEIAARAGARVVRHRSNKGYGASLKTGIRAATGEVVVTLDADSQNDPDEIAHLVQAIGDNDMVVGARGSSSSSPALRRPGKWLLGQVANYLARTDIPDLNSGFRAFRRSTVTKFLHILPNGFSFTTTITLALLKEGYNVIYVPITVKPRIGKSTVNPVTDGFGAVLLIIRTIALFDPLRVFLPVSAVLILAGMGYWIGDMLLRQNLHIPSGAGVLMVSSVIVFMFGILADQVSALRREKNE